MSETTSAQIESHIDRTREDLRTNLEELKRRVTAVVDWRGQFAKNPALGIGLAAGAGFLLGILSARPRRVTRGDYLARGPRASRTRRAWEMVEANLIALAAPRAAELLTDFLFGRTHERRRGTANTASDIQGEGDYRAAGRYRRSAEAHVRSADITGAAR